MKHRKFLITRIFIGGILDGLTHSGIFWYPMEVGFVCEKPIGGSPYRVIECVELEA